MTKSTLDTTTLNNGVIMPRLGLGTWQMNQNKQTETTIKKALEIGYRLVDTAAVYDNETSVGRVIKASSLNREEIFVTTKLWNSDQGAHATEAFHKSLARLGLGYIDLYLIHWPAPAGDRYLETWHILEKLYQKKLIRAIGVSNFNQSHLKKLLARSSIIPAINQIEIHPYFQQADLVAFCKAKGIQVESYSPLGGQGGSVLFDGIIKEIARKYKKSPAQIIIRWHLQNDYVVIPKAVNPTHLKANVEVFDFTLDEIDMAKITNLETGTRRGPDPAFFNSGIKTGLVQLAHKFGLAHWSKEKR